MDTTRIIVKSCFWLDLVRTNKQSITQFTVPRELIACGRIDFSEYNTVTTIVFERGDYKRKLKAAFEKLQIKVASKIEKFSFYALSSVHRDTFESYVLSCRCSIILSILHTGV